MELVDAAFATARRFVAPLGRRGHHVRAVAAKADGELRAAVPPEQREVLVAAAWLHDIGYSPDIGFTGFHPLDGARFLRDARWPDTVVNLVAHHSGARFEAAERGLSAELAEFPFEDSALLDALVAADLTTGPSGEDLTYDERVADIFTRYPPENPVHRTWLRARPVMAEAVDRVHERLARSVHRLSVDGETSRPSDSS